MLLEDIFRSHLQTLYQENVCGGSFRADDCSWSLSTEPFFRNDQTCQDEDEVGRSYKCQIATTKIIMGRAKGTLK